MHKLLLPILLLSSLGGCATIGTLGEPETPNKIFSGTVRHAELKCAHASCIDFPFSLVADIVLLPLTVPWTLSNKRSDERAQLAPLPAEQ